MFNALFDAGSKKLIKLIKITDFDTFSINNLGINNVLTKIQITA